MNCLSIIGAAALLNPFTGISASDLEKKLAELVN
jgi:hypothetical protein